MKLDNLIKYYMLINEENQIFYRVRGTLTSQQN